MTDTTSPADLAYQYYASDEFAAIAETINEHYAAIVDDEHLAIHVAGARTCLRNAATAARTRPVSVEPIMMTEPDPEPDPQPEPVEDAE